MKKITQKISRNAQQAHDYLLKIGQVTVDFAGVDRVPMYTLDRAENDVEHSFHLALSATELAANFHPELDMGLVAQFSLVHDLPEVYVGDVPTFNITSEARKQKEKAEKLATKRLLTELPPHMAQLLERYEKQVEPEARFVRFIDKLLPAVIHSVASDANRKIFMETYNLSSVKDVEIGENTRITFLKDMFPEFDFIHIVRGLVAKTSRDRIFKNEVN
jgi:5'-deoxynucleotidase YfbR-like HD superfamily hydrolase